MLSVVVFLYIFAAAGCVLLFGKSGTTKIAGGTILILAIAALFLYIARGWAPWQLLGFIPGVDAYISPPADRYNY